MKKKKMKAEIKYKCLICDLEVKEIPKFKKDECLDIQHYFIEVNN